MLHNSKLYTVSKLPCHFLQANGVFLVLFLWSGLYMEAQFQTPGCTSLLCGVQNPRPSPLCLYLKLTIPMGLHIASPFTPLNIPSLSIPCTQKLNSFCLNLVVDFKRFFFFVVYFVHHFYVFVVEIWPINKSSFSYVAEKFETL